MILKTVNEERIEEFIGGKIEFLKDEMISHKNHRKVSDSKQKRPKRNNGDLLALIFKQILITISIMSIFIFRLDKTLDAIESKTDFTSIFPNSLN
jgi:hypothetical protein